MTFNSFSHPQHLRGMKWTTGNQNTLRGDAFPFTFPRHPATEARLGNARHTHGSNSLSKQGTKYSAEPDKEKGGRYPGSGGREEEIKRAKEGKR